jgi:hypothetical protein
MCDAPFGSLNIAVNLCDEPALTDNMAETGDADSVATGTKSRVFVHPPKARQEQRTSTKRMLKFLPARKSKR